jgi:Na+-transporting NADH:ubiquinone oxidoreductase subunit C
MKKSYQYTVVFMILVASVFTAILATAQASMDPRIAENREIARQGALLYAFDIEHGEGNQAISEAYAKYIQEDTRTIDGETIEAYKQVDEAGQVTGYAFPFSGSALWGTIRGYLALNEDLSVIKGLTFTEQNETPGLGGRIDEEPFKAQWRGVPLPEGDLAYGTIGDKQVDAVSGATQSSTAVTRTLNELKDNVISKWEVQ